MPDPHEPGVLAEIPLTWVGAEDVPIQFVNQVLGQLDDQGDLIVSFGQATPPAILGDQEAQKLQAERIAYVPVRPIARFSMSRSRLNQVIVVLETIAKMHDRHAAALDHGKGGER